MAKVDIKMPEDFLERISRLGSDFDPVAQKVLEAGGEIVLAKAQSNLSSVVGNGTKYESRSTGELESALGLSSVKMDRTVITISRLALPNPAVTALAMQNWRTSSNTANTVSLPNLL